MFLQIILFTFVLLFRAAVYAEPYAFQEIWAYVLKGEEKWLKGSEPITDIAYFSAEVNEIGRLNEGIDLNKIPRAVRYNRRVHLVISVPGNRSLMYWCLSKDTETRQALIADILRASKPYDGLQIDFEVIRPEDRHAYWSFLKEIKMGLSKEKIFSVALPARTKELQDAFNYSQIAQIADKVLVMAYDEHWRTGPPGAIASVNWCEKVCNFSKRTIPENKLVMGIPLYGRVWQKQEVARALKYFQTLELWKQHPSVLKRDPDGTAHFEYKQEVDAVVYYEDLQSLSSKIGCYQRNGIQSIGFWRVSQEPIAVWKTLALKK